MTKGKSAGGAGVPPLPSSLPSSRGEPGTSDPASVGQRIGQVRGRIKQEDFARRLGVHPNTLGRYERGERPPDAKFLRAMVELENISTLWLLFGEPPQRVVPSGASPGEHRAAEPEAGYVHIPLYDVRAAAGLGSLNENEAPVDVLAFKESWIRQELRATPADLRLIFVEGDSMEPDLRAGDIVLLDHTDTTARREGVYVIRMDGALLVKQLQRLPGGVLKVISRNPAYEPFTVPVSKLEEPADFALIGRVVWACRRF